MSRHATREAAWIDSIGTDHELPAPLPGAADRRCVPRTLTYAPVARDDLRAIRSWLAQAGSGLAARRRLRGIRTAINRLIEHPCLATRGQPRHQDRCSGGPPRALGWARTYRIAA